MAKKLLIVNVGSSSQKYAFYEDEKQKFFAHFETLGEEFALRIEKNGTSGEKIKISQKDFLESSRGIIELLKNEGFVSSPKEIDAIGFRVVHGGDKFFEPYLIDEDFIRELEEVKDLAPLHMEPAIVEMKEFIKIMPSVKKVAVFDTNFHKDLPDVSKFYALPLKVSQDLKIHRYGFHGISCQSVLEKIKKEKGTVPEKLIICHLGSGSSITAVKNDKSFDTSMGFTPLEGIPMGTRAGDLDSGIILYLMKNEKYSVSEIIDSFSE